ncbi:uncharacterized protein BKA78DRAFT_364833, partial [Phyllosticta capitalensis]|uniref:uncharacterized protein n=1 Tax=Phyllosticta capitalensis TaxID=121624 RepID=UPI00312F64C4
PLTSSNNADRAHYLFSTSRIIGPTLASLDRLQEGSWPLEQSWNPPKWEKGDFEDTEVDLSELRVARMLRFAGGGERKWGKRCVFIGDQVGSNGQFGGWKVTWSGAPCLVIDLGQAIRGALMEGVGHEEGTGSSQAPRANQNRKDPSFGQKIDGVFNHPRMDTDDQHSVRRSKSVHCSSTSIQRNKTQQEDNFYSDSVLCSLSDPWIRGI